MDRPGSCNCDDRGRLAAGAIKTLQNKKALKNEHSITRGPRWTVQGARVDFEKNEEKEGE
jgi:hypothetical protein